jgi:hypothetical protein
MIEAGDDQALPVAVEVDNLRTRNANHQGADRKETPDEVILPSKDEPKKADQPRGEQESLIQADVERAEYPYYKSPPSIELCKAHQLASRCDNEFNFLSIDDQHSSLM